MSPDRRTPLVIDASAFIDYLLGTDLGLAVADVIEGADIELHTPELCEVEVCSSMRRLVRAGIVEPERAAIGLGAFLDLPVAKHRHRSLIPRIFQLRDNFASSDAAYVALSEQLDATFVTCDARLTRAVQQLLPLNVVGVT